MSKTKFFLTVHTDQYTGNWDSFLCGLLFGYDDDRHGTDEGMKKHIGFPADDVDLVDHPDAFNGYDLPYKVLVDDGCEGRNLEFALDGPLSVTQREHLAKHYSGKAFGHETEFITIFGFTENIVKIVKEKVSIQF